MKGVILSGGKGTRLAPLTLNYPKQMVPVLGKPILFHCIEYLRAAGIDDIGIILSPQTGPLIEEKIAQEDFSGLKLTYIYQEEPLGLGHAVYQAKDFIGDTDDFIVLLGDNLFNQDLSELIDKYKTTNADSLILLKEVERPYNFGVAKFNEDGKVEALVEKPKTKVSNFAIVGSYIFNKKIFDYIEKTKPSARGEVELTDAIAHEVDADLNVQTSILENYWFDTGTREGLLDANKKILLSSDFIQKGELEVRNSHLVGKVQLGHGSTVINSNLMGPIFVGKNCRIENSVIGPFTCISDNCSIIDGELQETILMESSEVRESTVVSSVLFKDSLTLNVSEMINKIVGPQEVAA